MTSPTLQSQLRLLLPLAGIDIAAEPPCDACGGYLVQVDPAGRSLLIKCVTLGCEMFGEPIVALVKSTGHIPLPGASGTLASSEVGLVLSWLAKAGYVTTVDPEYADLLEVLIQKPVRSAVQVIEEWVGHGDTLEAALTEAVLKLELAK